MAKKKSFGKNPQQEDANSPMAKVIISTKLGNNKYAFKESMVKQDNVKEYINENKS
ncbi:MAG TPA: DUF4295 domain-containing protein [Balneolaceae bacterium]|nr:DUF4295 domain-containing protein [Balneolaceae bacterium]